MSDLHDQIMNLRAEPPEKANINQRTSFKEGHNNAIYAAAELALESDRRIAELEKDRDYCEKRWNEALTTHENIAALKSRIAELEAALREAREALHLTRSIHTTTLAIDGIDKLLKD